MGPAGYTEVLFFTVKMPAVHAKCTAITTSTGATLVSSVSHGIFTQDGDAVPAGSLQVGDALLKAGKITHLEQQPCQGAIHPITEAGSIIVGGVTTSDYGPAGHALGHTTTHALVWPARVLRATFPNMELWQTLHSYLQGKVKVHFYTCMRLLLSE
jgi:hypothetical protein